MKINPPKLTKTGLELANTSQLIPESSLEQVKLSHLDASNLRAKNLSLDEALLECVLLIEARLEKLSLTDAELKACDMSAARCAESSLIRLHIIGGRMTGLDLSCSTIKDVVFEDCKLDMANFRFAKLTRVRFVSCQVVETDFQAAELTDVEFRGCQLERAEFGQCKLKNVDARTSRLYDIHGWQSLKGLTIDSAQLVTIAPQLAVELGLKIADE